jgi:hypothetical protein
MAISEKDRKMTDLARRLMDVVNSDEYVMMLLAPKVTPSIHCMFMDPETGACSWVFPERNCEPNRWPIGLDLLTEDMKRGDLIPLHINPEFVL